MKRLFSVGGAALASLVFFGCPGEGNPLPDSGTELDAGLHVEEPVVRVSGAAAVHPNAASWLTAQSLTVPSIDGLSLSVEEPLKVALADDQAVFGTATLGSDGAFSVPDVDTANINVGISAGIGPPGGTGTSEFLRAGTVLFDVKVNEGKPDTDLTGAKAWALPKLFHDQLGQAVTPAKILNLTGNQFGTLIEAGFIFGRVIDASGQPVPGVKLVTSPASWGDRIFYLSEDLNQASQDGTSANGLFVYVHNGGATEPFTFTVEGRTEYLPRNAPAAKDRALLMDVFPGRTPPP